MTFFLTFGSLLINPPKNVMNYLMYLSSWRRLLTIVTILMLISALLRNRCLILLSKGATKGSIPVHSPTEEKKSSQISKLDSLLISNLSSWGKSCSKCATKKGAKYELTFKALACWLFLSTNTSLLIFSTKLVANYSLGLPCLRYTITSRWSVIFWGAYIGKRANNFKNSPNLALFTVLAMGKYRWACPMINLLKRRDNSSCWCGTTTLLKSLIILQKDPKLICVLAAPSSAMSASRVPSTVPLQFLRR